MFSLYRALDRAAGGRWRLFTRSLPLVCHRGETDSWLGASLAALESHTAGAAGKGEATVSSAVLRSPARFSGWGLELLRDAIA